MGIQIAETAERTEQRENLIETSYIGDHPSFTGTNGEAYFDIHSSNWMYRPLNGLEFEKVEGEDLDCVDSGWVNGTYTGERKLNTEGKARWSEEREMWEYKPKGFPRMVFIGEGEFTISRDEDF